MTIDRFVDDYYFLSNFSDSDFVYDDIPYKNAEAAFQAQKCSNKEDRRAFSELNSTEAKKLGRKIELRKEWEKIKVKEMKNIVYAKFSQNQELKERLLDTGDAYLEEGNTWGDRIWGTVDGNGANLLGIILMEVRNKMRE